MTLPAIEGWRAYVESHDTQALHALLDEDAVFESPVVHTPQRGREITFRYLMGALSVLGGPQFRYTGEWANDTGVVLEFETVIDGVTINGVDLITCTPDGQRISHFKVMIRPLKAINLLHRLMGEQLAKAGAA